jgi:hypothetical protein
MAPRKIDDLLKFFGRLMASNWATRTMIFQRRRRHNIF